MTMLICQFAISISVITEKLDQFDLKFSCNHDDFKRFFRLWLNAFQVRDSETVEKNQQLVKV